jgi:chromatin structure-remodeling complex subunit RSC3/30
VLGLELLRQSRSSSRSTAVTSISLPRSEVIQNLSNLVAQLKSTVQPEDGNYALCLQARRVIQRILDQVLQPEYYTAKDSPEEQRFETSVLADVTTDQLDWLGTKSEFEFWSTLPRHPLLQS